VCDLLQVAATLPEDVATIFPEDVATTLPVDGVARAFPVGKVAHGVAAYFLDL
jgi:hypothetical protein